MSNEVLLISEAYIKENSFVEGNIDGKMLSPVVRVVQDRYMHTMLGTTLYRKLQDMVKNRQSTPIPDSYRALIEDYVQPSLLWYVLADLPVPLQYKVVPKGVVQRSDATIQTTSTTDRKELMDYCRGYAEWYAQRAIDYLRANASLYPEYTSPGAGCDNIAPARTQYSTGIYLGRTPYGSKGEFRDKYK